MNPPGWPRLLTRLAHSPGWVRKLQSHGVLIEELREGLEWCKIQKSLPELTRQELALHPEEWLSELSTTSGPLEWAWSSGSSGNQPLRVARSGVDRALRWALMGRAFRHHGGAPQELRRGAFLCALPGRPEYLTFADSEERIPIDRISLRDPEWQDRLAAGQPDFLNLSPVGLQTLLGVRDHGKLPRLKAVFSTALHLPLALRKRAAHELQCPVIDLYSTAETGPIGFACSASDNVFHLFSPNIEVHADPFGILVTRFSDSILPILNYRISDHAVEVSPRCPHCRFSSPTLIGFRGRTLSTKGEHALADFPAAI